MNQRYNRWSLAWGLPGVFLQFVGTGIVGTATMHRRGPDPSLVLTGLLVGLGGTVLFIVGLALYAKAKGRHWAWGFLGLLWLIGLLVLGLLRDRAPEGRVGG